jgi:cell division cycle 2-like protein
MSEAPTAARKRPAPEDGVCLEAAAAAKKRPCYQSASTNDYKKLEVLGEGSYSVVFEARHQRTGEKVAVRWIRGSGGGPGRSAVFREDGCLAACRGHPSIMQIKDVTTNEATGDLFIVMELVCSSLCDLLTWPLSEDQTLVFISSSCTPPRSCTAPGRFTVTSSRRISSSSPAAC